MAFVFPHCGRLLHRYPWKGCGVTRGLLSWARGVTVIAGKQPYLQARCAAHFKSEGGGGGGARYPWLPA